MNAAAFVADLQRLAADGGDDGGAAARTALHLFDLSPSGQPLNLAHVPGRLDVLGGVTDIFGGLSLQAITQEGTLAVAQAKAGTAGVLRVVSLMPGEEDGGATTLSALLPLSALSDGLASVAAALAGGPPWVRYVGGSVAAVAAGHPLARLSSLTLLIASAVPPGAGLASSASLCVAVCAAVGGVLSEGLPKAARRALVATAPAAAWRAETVVAGAPCGPADQAAVWWGEGGALLPVDCGAGLSNPLPVCAGPALLLPPGWAAVGLRSGARHSVGGHENEGGAASSSPPPYHAARAAGFMAARLLEEAAGMPPGGAPPHFLCAWSRPGVARPDAALASLPPTLTGAAWEAEHPPTGDAATTPPAPSHPYPVRAAGEHAVCDASRAWGVRAALEEGKTEEGAAALGEAMARSHAGYGRLGLGHPATDALVAQLTGNPLSLIAGARASGGGAGGAVVALVAATAEARAAMAAAAAAAAPGAHPHWAAPAGALGGSGFGVIRLAVPGLTVVEDSDEEEVM